MSIALTVTWSLATTALLLGFGRLKGRTPAAAVAVASLLPLTGIALGVVLRDGFLPVLLLVPLLLATVTSLGWLQVAAEGPRITWVVGITAAALPVLAFTWTPFAVVAGCAALPPWWRSIRSSSGRTRTLRLALMAGGVVTSAAYTVVVLANSLDFIEINGSIAAPAPPTTILVPLLVLLIAAGRWSAVRAPAFIPYLAGTAATAAITIYTILIQPEGVIWGYFPSKVPWIWTLVGLTMLLLPFAHPYDPPAPAVPGPCWPAARPASCWPRLPSRRSPRRSCLPAWPGCRAARRRAGRCGSGSSPPRTRYASQ